MRPFPSTRRVLRQPEFVPMTQDEVNLCGWEELDVLLVSGDAYVDHPSFGMVLLARLLIAQGFRTALLCQPDWRREESFTQLGRPRLFCGIGAGNVDSMLAHYSAFRQKRRHDAFSPGGRMGLRPNRATIVYANCVKKVFPDLPLVLGGIEASTRRLTHYDFWSDQLRRPLLLDARADLLVWGMGERAIVEVAERLDEGKSLLGIAGSAWVSSLEDEWPGQCPLSAEKNECVLFPSHEEIREDPKALLTQAHLLEEQVHQGKWGFEKIGGRAVVVAKPALPLTTEEMDALYGLPFTRLAHPSYSEPIPAQEMMLTSITSHRGCGGGCSFCSIQFHQGRFISSRSEQSIMNEAKWLGEHFSSHRGKKGVAISDVGGPTANMWQTHCVRKQACSRKSCTYPGICPNFETQEEKYLALLRNIQNLDSVKKVRVASGIRADLALQKSDVLRAYVREFTGGQLKLAPEHCVGRVLDLMRKPGLSVFERFLEIFVQENRRCNRKQYVVPYLMSAFPGCTEEDMRELMVWLDKRHWTPQQTQCFVPTPATVATAMFYAGIDEKGQKIFVARSDRERLSQHGLLQKPSLLKETDQRKGQKREERVRTPKRKAHVVGQSNT